MDIVDRIRALSKAKNKSLKDVGLETGIGENAIYRWRKQLPKIENLEKVADYFGVSTDYLLGRDNSSPDMVDREFVTITRAAKEMTPEQRRKALKIWEAAFDDEDLWQDK